MSINSSQKSNFANTCVSWVIGQKARIYVGFRDMVGDFLDTKRDLTAAAAVKTGQNLKYCTGFRSGSGSGGLIPLPFVSGSGSGRPMGPPKNIAQGLYAGCNRAAARFFSLKH